MPKQTEVSLVVPTINEAGSLPELAKRIATSMANRTYEVLVVDDGSEDDTQRVCKSLGRALPLTLHSRRIPSRGLSGAILYGFARSMGRVLVAMDADLQHPPESLPSVVDPLLSGEADFVIGSRYVNGAGFSGAWGMWRRVNSAAARLLAAPIAWGVRDTTSGFFALRRATFQHAAPLNPLGYKIGLELLCKCGPLRIKEVPIQFAARVHGQSKLSIVQRLQYLQHVAGLYRFRCSQLIGAPLGFGGANGATK